MLMRDIAATVSLGWKDKTMSPKSLPVMENLQYVGWRSHVLNARWCHCHHDIPNQGIRKDNTARNIGGTEYVNSE